MGWFTKKTSNVDYKPKVLCQSQNVYDRKHDGHIKNVPAGIYVTVQDMCYVSDVVDKAEELGFETQVNSSVESYGTRTLITFIEPPAWIDYCSKVRQEKRDEVLAAFKTLLEARARCQEVEKYVEKALAAKQKKKRNR